MAESDGTGKESPLQIVGQSALKNKKVKKSRFPSIFKRKQKKSKDLVVEPTIVEEEAEETRPASIKPSIERSLRPKTARGRSSQSSRSKTVSPWMMPWILSKQDKNPQQPGKKKRWSKRTKSDSHLARSADKTTISPLADDVFILKKSEKLSKRDRLVQFINSAPIDRKDTVAHEGNFENGKSNGNGERYTADGNLQYTGEWKNDKKHGFGKYYQENGRRYEGSFVEDKKHGSGTDYGEDDKIIYSGEFVDGERHGRGTLYLPKGCRYEGDIAAGEMHGTGIYYWNDGTFYEGEFTKGQRHGQGALTKNGMLKFSGEWENSRYSRGTYYYLDPDLDKYDGQFDVETGEKSGFGVMYWADGGRYKGTWLADRQSGEGKEYTGDHLKYDGQWKRGVKSGTGTLYFYDGRRYEGEWLADMRHGYGKLYDEHGGLRYEGKWCNDNPSSMFQRKRSFLLSNKTIV